MTLSHNTVTYDVHDCKVYPFTADSGASPAFGTGVDVPGIAAVTVNPNIIAQELKGDARVLDRRARIDQFNFSATYGKLDLDVLAVILGTEVSDTGADPNRKASTDFEGGNEPPFFGVVFQMEDTDVGIGALRVALWKTKITGGTLVTGQTDQYGQPTLEAGAIATDAHNKMMRVELFETSADIPTTFPA